MSIFIHTFVDRDLETWVSLYTDFIISSKLILMISTDPGRRSRSHIITAPYTHVLHLMIFLIQFCRESSEPTPLSVESYPICVILPKYLISTLTVRPHLSNDSRLTSATQKSTLTLSCWVRNMFLHISGIGCCGVDAEWSFGNSIMRKWSVQAFDSMKKIRNSENDRKKGGTFIFS